MKKIIQLTGLLILFLSFVNTITAQKSAIIKGRVIDQSTNENLPFVNVVEVDTKGRFVSGTVSDINGNYILKLKDASDSIQVSFIGYKKNVFSIGDRTTINVLLEQESTSIQEVKVTAAKISSDGITQVRDRATAVTRLETKELKSVMSTTVEEMIQGRMGNVDITSVSGDPGAGLNIRIRGTATINGKNSPLIVVNGIPYTSDFGDFDFAGADVQKFGNLIDVSPEDIESIEILKDAASTAVWGSAAANGVIMIKTKRGIKSKPMFEYTFKYTIAEEPEPIPMLDNGGYARLIRDAVQNYKNSDNPDKDVDDITELRQIDFEPSKNFNYYDFTQNTNWVKEITQVAYTQQHDFSVRGGGDKSKYNLSLGYFDEGGTVIGNRSRKLNLRSSLDYDLSKNLKFNSDIMYTHYDDDATYDRDNDMTAVRSIAYKTMPNLSVFVRDTSGNPTNQYYTGPTLQAKDGEYYNPVALARLGVSNKIKDNARALFSINYNILPELIWKSTVTLDIFDSKQSSFLPAAAIGNFSWNTNMGTNKFNKKSSIFTKNQLIYNPKLNSDHDLGILGQFDTEETLESSTQVKTKNSASGSLQQPVGNKNIDNMESGFSRYRALGIFASVNYKYKDKYIFMLGTKMEGTSKYSSKSRWGMFPTTSVAWRISGEEFMKPVTLISDFKLRASWGKSGNLPTDQYLYFNKYESKSSYSYLDLYGTKPVNMELTSLRWETVEQINLGVDLSMFKDRVTFIADFYDKRTQDLYLKDTDIPNSSGFSTININNGELLNRGIELSLDVVVIKTEDFQFDFNVNVSKNENKVISLPENYSYEVGGENMLNNGGYMMKIVPGQAIGSVYGYVYEGVYSYTKDAVAKDDKGNPIIALNGSPLTMQMGNNGARKYNFLGGDAKYKDVNYDGVIDKRDVVYLGDLNPEYMGGGGLKVRYKNVTINSFFTFKYGSEIINKTRMLAENMASFDNQTKATNSRWRKEGDVTDVPRALWSGPNKEQPWGYNWLGSSRFVEDGSFIRFKSVSLTYIFPKKVCEALKVNELKMYATGYNIYTWTNYSGQDPDVAPPSKPNVLPVDENLTPPSMRLLIGINVTF